MTNTDERHLILQEMVAKLFVTALSIGSVVLLGLTLHFTGELNWFISATVFGGSLFIQQTLNGPALNRSAAQEHLHAYLDKRIDPAAPTLLGIDKKAALETLAHLTKLPILRRISMSLALRLLGAIAFGVFVATVDRVLMQSLLELLGQSSVMGRMLGGLILLMLIYTSLGLVHHGVRYREDTWYAELKEKLRRTFPVTAQWDHFIVPILIESAVRALLSVIAREIAFATIPPLFDNKFLPWFLIATFVLFIVAGGYIILKAKRAMDAARTLLTPEERANDGEATPK